MPPALVLASTSPYRRELLARLRLAFECQPPDVVEDDLEDESPHRRSARLAQAKATAVASSRPPGTLVVGSDQVAALGDRVLHKPGSATAARQQLRDCSERSVSFHTAVCLLPAGGAASVHVDLTRVRFRKLGEAEIERYVTAESPLDCAGSFKAEGLGISLFRAIESEDPTALIGLPLIALAAMLREHGLLLP